MVPQKRMRGRRGQQICMNEELLFQTVMQIRLNHYTDPDPGSENSPYKSGSESKEKTSQNSIFQIFVGKNVLTLVTYRYRTALYKIS